MYIAANSYNVAKVCNARTDVACNYSSVVLAIAVTSTRVHACS